MGDVDLFELNEAFAAQSLAVVKELGVDTSKVSPCNPTNICTGKINDLLFKYASATYSEVQDIVIIHVQCHVSTTQDPNTIYDQCSTSIVSRLTLTEVPLLLATLWGRLDVGFWSLCSTPSPEQEERGAWQHFASEEEWVLLFVWRELIRFLNTIIYTP